MHRALPEHWLLSVLCGPLAVLVGATALGWSPWVGALVLTAPALVMALSSAGAPVVASYLLGVLAASASLLHSGLPQAATLESVLSGPTPLAVAVAAMVTLASQVMLGDAVKRWTVATALALLGAGGFLSFELCGGSRAFESNVEAAPEILLNVPACNSVCEMRPSPSGHLRCSTTTKNERAFALRECDGSAGFVHVRSEGQETSVLVGRDEPAVIWREASGKLLVEQGGVPVRALSPQGAVLLSSSFTAQPRQPGYLLHLAGASLLLVGAALVLVLRSHREQRMLAGGLVGHVEAGRFFPRDRQLLPVAVVGAWRNGPALLFGKARRASYRDGGGEAARVVSGTSNELAARHAMRRLGAWAAALGVVLFAMVSVAADLARLQ